jgi:hypothetical protein
MAELQRKLGELMAEHGEIAAIDIEKTLASQAIHGGRFGTNLVDLGLVDLEQVGFYLALQLGVPMIHGEELLDAPPEVLEILTGRQCASYSVFPVALEGATLKLAMLDPHNEVAQRELSLLTRMRVVPGVTPELVLVRALEKRYGITRDKRFLRAPSEGETVHAETATSSAPQPVRKPAISLIMPMVSEEMEGELQLDAPPPVEQEEEEYIDSDVTGRWTRPEVGVNDLEATIVALQQTHDREAVAKHLVDALRSGCGGCVVFTVRGTMGVAQAANRTMLGHDELEQLALSLTSSSLLEQAYNTRMAIRAWAGNDPMQQVIADHLGWPDPGEACVAPITHQGQVVHLLCVQTEPRARFSEAFVKEIGQLCDATEAAIDRLVRSHIESSATLPALTELMAIREAGGTPQLSDSRYSITGRAGKRSVAEVWRAVDATDRRVVALHVMPADALDEDQISGLADEVALLQQLSHPGLPELLGAGLTRGGRPYVVMEWLEAMDLRTHLELDPVPPRAEVASIVQQICEVLDLVHGKGVVHRNLEPENVLLTGAEHKQVKLVNFSAASAPVSAGYLAPELSMGMTAGPAADVYALAAICYEMLVGSSPQGQLDPRSLAADLASLPSRATKVVTSGLSTDPRSRPKPRELGHELAHALMQVPLPE